MITIIQKTFILLFICSLILSCKTDSKPESTQVKDKMIYVPEASSSDRRKNLYDLPSWAKNATIYEVNIRQYTEEGTIRAFAKNLKRLRSMGVDILWLMPIYPISKEKRKGSLGSYYAVSDFKDVNPEFGTKRDLQILIGKAHELNMKVILDFVPNHTGWGHSWIKEHPEYYTQDKNGNIIDPIDPNTGKSWGWTDVADLNFENQEMRNELIECMEYWVKDFKIDGFRQDVAHGVPVDFWKQASDRLLKLKPLFLLAESEVPELRNNGYFHADYGWSFHHLLNEIAKGEKPASEISKWYDENRKKYSRGFHMHFTSNHDENSWSGTTAERMGRAHKAMAVLVSTFDGTPLIYGGQEEPLKKRLEFFEKDVIPFINYSMGNFYTKLNETKHENTALWNGSFGVEPEIIFNDEQLLVYSKKKNNNEAFVILNLSDKEAKYTLPRDFDHVDVMNGRVFKHTKGTTIGLEPWGYYLIVNRF